MNVTGGTPEPLVAYCLRVQARRSPWSPLLFASFYAPSDDASGTVGVLYRKGVRQLASYVMNYVVGKGDLHVAPPSATEVPPMRPYYYNHISKDI